MKEYPEYKVTVKQKWGSIYWEDVETMTPFEYDKAIGKLRKDNENDN